jgi:predicted MFS family arabinose efflux permease
VLTGTKSFLHATYGGLPGLTWLVCGAAFVNRAGAMVVPFLSLYLGKRFGYSVEAAGYVVSLYGLGAIAGNLVGGKLTDVLGPVRVQIATLSGAALWMWALTQATSPAWLGAGVFVLGVLNDAFRPGNMAAVVASVPPHLASTALTLNRVAINAGWAIGPTVGGHLAEVDFRWLFVVDGATCALAGLLLWLLVPRALGCRRDAPADAAAAPPPRALSPWRDGRFLALLGVTIATLLVFMQYFSTQTRHLAHVFGFTEREIGWLLAVNPVLIVLVEMPLVRWLRRFHRLHVVALGTLLIGLSFPLLVPVAWGLPGVLAQLVLLTTGEMLSFSLLGSFVSDHAPHSQRGSYLGVHGAAFSLALVFAPGLGGWVYDRVGADALWSGCAVVGALAALGYLLLHRVYGRVRAAS